MKRQKRAMVMIVVVILIAAITTIIAASVDLSRMAVYKQNQAEREAKWQYCVDSGRAFVVEDLVALAGTTQSFSKTVNGIDLTVNASPDGAWNSSTSTQITVTGILNGKSRTTKLYVGNRATVQPCQFGLFFTTIFSPDNDFGVTGDVYMAGTIDARKMTLNGDIYCPATTPPLVAGQTGAYFGRQPGQTITFDKTVYAANATVTTSGNITLNNPTNLSIGARSQLRYHTGNLTIRGTTTGEITIFVDGDVNLDDVTDLLSTLGRLVVISTGKVTFSGNTSDAFVICKDEVHANCKIINGSISGVEFSKCRKDLVVNYDNYFVANPNGGNRYWLPGQW